MLQYPVLVLTGKDNSMKTLLLLAVISTACRAQMDCSLGACYPPSQDLLLGRVQQLQASSTCGLTESEVFCTLYQQRRIKCCPCDSRNPNSQLAHTVQDVLSTSGPERWWQSKKGVTPVSLQLDLNSLFQLESLVLSFKGPRPGALVIEKTLDHGLTWQPALYLATDCQRSFPSIPTSSPLTLEDTYCHPLKSNGPNPNQEQTIDFSPLRQYMFVPASHSQKVEAVSGLTGLRVKLTELGDVPQLPGRGLSQFYALKEMRVIGSCMCHGHANRCVPQDSSVPVSPQCDCQHNTAGLNCERCADLYNDLPWRAAEDGNTQTCKRCECNNHAQSCHFDWALFESSGRRSGGVCDNCMHHTTGPQCDRCAPGYQPNPRSRMDRPDACIRCSCSSDGTVDGGRCEDSPDSCRCKEKVEGPRCDRCKTGFYGLSASNPAGCSPCSCSPDGSMSDVCEPVTGQCPCQPHFQGRTCDRCSSGYWKPALSKRCEPCSCDPTSSTSDACDQLTGQCWCRPGFGGRTCSECPDGSYGDPLTGCQRCQCDAEGSLPGGCDKQTGACRCQPGVTGARCDSCSRGYCNAFPSCKQCPSCFFYLDRQLRTTSLALERISKSLISRPGEGAPLDPLIQALEDQLNQIRSAVSFPPESVSEVKDALSQLEELRKQLEQANGNLPSFEKTPGLASELAKLQDVFNQLTLIYKAKKAVLENSISSENTGALDAIRKSYDESNEAAERVNSTRTTLQEAVAVRQETKDLQGQVQPTNTRDLSKLNHSMASQPNLTPIAKQACGSSRLEPCTPLQCIGEDLCPPEGAPSCEKAAECVGALPLSRRANADAEDVKERLGRLKKKITEAAEKLQKTQEKTKEVRQSAEKLSDKIKQAKDGFEEDLKATRGVVKELKDFLSDPSSNLTQIQEVSDWILKAKLPLSIADLRKKLDELKDLAANLPNSTAVLKEAEPQLDMARKLLQDAQDTRDVAVGVKADVDELLTGFSNTEGALSELEDKLLDITDLINSLSSNLSLSEDLLSPAEKALDEASALIKPMKSQLEDLKTLLQDAGQQAQEAEEKATEAEEEATAADQDLQNLEKQLDRLRKEAPPGTTAGSTEDRLAKLKEDAAALTNTTETMTQTLDGKADSLRKLQDEVLQKSSKLEGLDTKVKELLDKLRKKAHDLRVCQG
ncbi:laminin subunit beta-3 isoform X2 [Oryzias latipes]|uniref:laminin subunit beta-3 isoform X2 n=1 Tax=Oryzias latipes TaxID=8090 RepID=UPI0009DAEB87|nr:laminin subunit beta-3 isoform X2 [Oryzias latipes]